MGADAVVVSNRPEVAEVHRLVLELPAAWRHVPGQVAELSAGPGSEGYFAIASAPGEAPRLSFLVKAGGSASAPLMAMRPGDRVAVTGPLGRGYDLDWRSPGAAPPTDLLLVGAGTALGALRSALIDAFDGPRSRFERIALIVGVREEADLCLTAELAAWRDRGATVEVVVSRPSAGWLGPRGRVQHHLGRVLDSQRAAQTLALLAGSEAFEDDVTAALVEAGVPFAQIQRNFRPDGRDRRAA